MQKKGVIMNRELKGKIFNDDIRVIETSTDYAEAFRLIEKENENYKKAVLKNIRQVRYVCS